MTKQARGIKTRDRILKRAVQLASVEGLDSLSVGTLAQALGLSKGGLFAHFGSKDALQLAILDEAKRIFSDTVLAPSESALEGLPRLFALQSQWIGYLQAQIFKGGCFFASASHEFDGRPGPVRTRVAALSGQWRERLAGEARRARELGHLRPDADPARIAFLLHGLTLEANWAHQLLNDPEAFVHARELSETLLRDHATPEGLRAAKSRRVVPARPEGVLS